jgi:hypothetical protein
LRRSCGKVAVQQFGTRIAHDGGVNIRLTSTLTSEDENGVAQVIFRTLVEILSLLPVAYALRIDTSDSRAYEHSSTDVHPYPDILPLERELQPAAASMPDGAL